MVKRGEIEDSLGHYLENLAIRGLLKLALSLPYRSRVRFMGWLMSHDMRQIGSNAFEPIWRMSCRTCPRAK